MKIAAGPLREGETVVLLDRKNREYTMVLKGGNKSDIRGGMVSHDELIGMEEGAVVRSSSGESFIMFRPTLAQFILNMPRGAQVIYPKDIGVILIWADIYPGATVVEGGIGSGALTMALLRAVGPEGRVISYEIRQDFARRAIANIRQYMGEPDNLTVKIKDIYMGVEEKQIDRIILDLPEPWRVVESAAESLRSGGILLGYIPTVLQVKTLLDTLKDTGNFTLVQTVEVLIRPWDAKGLSLRPAHRMVAHTGFLTVARKKNRGGNIAKNAPPRDGQCV